MQDWEGVRLPPEEYGWDLKNGRYVPSQGYTEFCPKEIASLLSCGCKRNCKTQNCSCKKSGVKCTEICKCTSDECQNEITHYDTCPEDDEEESDVEE